MLTRNQWQWCADHHRGIRKTATVIISFFVLLYCYLFLELFWWNNKIPVIYQPKISQMQRMNCMTYEVREMFIPSVNKMSALQGNMINYVRSSLEREDARVLLLEKYETAVLGSEILSERPDCLGALIADNEHFPGAYAILIVDRNSGKTIFRIARIDGSLAR
jgi:hypothetical protein